MSDRVRNDRGEQASRQSRSTSAPLGELLQGRLSRRGVLTAALGLSALASTGGVASGASRGAGTFREISLRRTPREILPQGYRSRVLIAWGDPLSGRGGRSSAIPTHPAAAASSFGYNCDFLAWLPPQPGAPSRNDHGLLWVNHEYPSPHLMWPRLRRQDMRASMSEAQIACSMASVGGSVLEVHRERGTWSPKPGSRYARRITGTSPMRLSGPAAGHPLLRTAADPDGRTVRGTLSNCNGGVTPWGTVLSCEEGAAWIFGGSIDRAPNVEALRRYYYGPDSVDRWGWARLDSRFDLSLHPHEPNRYEWVVEIDPYDPLAAPVKRTALGRFAHEGAHTAVAPDGRVVVYLGDDWEFEYCYRFVTERAWHPQDRAANRDLLDDGVLSVARFHGDGTLEWVPLIAGLGPLTTANGFASQADVCINARRAADLVGATPMDAPEGFQPHPLTGSVFLALTSNDARESPDAANPRRGNRFGHLLELHPPQRLGRPDHAADVFEWEVLALCGDPAVPEHAARFHSQTSRDGWFTDPDNLGFDPSGRLWVCTDGVQPQGHDGLYVMDVTGPGRALPRLFYCPPAGAECCSPVFTPDGSTLFLSVQHPGEGAEALEEVATRWPDFDSSRPPRPAVVAITRDGGLPI